LISGEGVLSFRRVCMAEIDKVFPGAPEKHKNKKLRGKFFPPLREVIF
jgi:hypothetical protein